jgi:hypothetical protein
LLAQAETDDLYKKINEYETAAKEANSISDKYDADIRDMSKKVQKLEVSRSYEEYVKVFSLSVQDPPVCQEGEGRERGAVCPDSTHL